MTAVACNAFVTASSRRWARVRVRGLRGDETLVGHLVAAGFDATAIRRDTGAVRVALTAERDEAYWVALLSAQVMAHAAELGESPGSAAADAAVTQLAHSHGVSGANGANGANGAKTAGIADVADTTHSMPINHLLDELGVAQPFDAERGLTAAQARDRLAREGANQIEDVTGRSAGEILLGQVKSVPAALLGGSAALALATRAYPEAAAIGAVLAANATLGFVTEKQAEATVSSLRKMAPREATVLRDGAEITIAASAVVVGDVLVLKPGQAVAADARVLQAHRLATNEAALTGESMPVRKEAVAALPETTPLGERRNMVFMGTVVSGGADRALVVATAERAALGRIRQLAQGAQAPHTQLQQELDALGRRLAIGAATLCVGVFALGALRGRPLLPLLRTAVSLGVAAIPEGLPTVATSLLASGVRSLAKRQIYARRLDAIENLGAVDTVCFDKTGTLTQNRMSVASLTVGLALVVLDDEHPPPTPPLPWLQVAVLCNSVERAADGLVDGAPNSKSDSAAALASPWQGSSTEIALLEFAVARGADVHALRRSLPRLDVRHRFSAKEDMAARVKRPARKRTAAARKPRVSKALKPADTGPGNASA